MDPFLLKNHGIIRKFRLNVWEIREKLLSKIFFSDKFSVAFIFSYVLFML